MNKVWRNRALLAIGISVIALGLFAIQYFGAYDIKGLFAPPEKEGFDPVAVGDRIEAAAPHIDVLHVGVVESIFLMNPVFHVGILFFPQPNPYSVEMTDTGWRILGVGEYTWEPEQEETVHDRWHFWTEEKYKYYSERAMFPPGKMQWISPAVEDLHSWFQDKLLTQFLMAVYKEAIAVQEEDPWVAIEISYLGVSGPELTLGIDASGKPGYVYKMDPILGFIELQWKKVQDTPEGEGYWIAEVVERGEFTVDEYRELKELQAILESPAWSPWYGYIPYTYGFNHPWQGRNVPS